MLLILITLGLTFFYYQYNLRIQSKTLHHEFTDKNTLLFKTVQLGLEVGLQTERFDAIQTVFKWAKKQENLSWIIITDESNEIFANFPDDLKTEGLLALPHNNLNRDLYILKGKWKGDGVKGNVTIAFDTNELVQAKKTIFQQSLKVATITILITIILSLLLSKLLITPLEKLQKVIHMIAEGNFHHTLEKVSGSRETVDLGNSFNLMMGELNKERDRSEKLLLNILPAPVAKRLKQGEEKIAISTDDITILFADLVGFTKYSSGVSAEELVDMLNLIFREIDDLITKYQLEKIKTIGDCYMITGGIFGDKDHQQRMILFAQEMIQTLERHNKKYHTEFKIRVGIHQGKAVAGVLGKSKFVFDVWGDSVNIASRMESSGEPNKIQVSADFLKSIEGKFSFDVTDRGHIPIKGKGEMNCFFISPKNS